MRKEIVIAIVAGILIGLLVAFGSWRANMAMKDKSDINIAQVASDSGNLDTTSKNEITSTDFSITFSNVDNYDVLTETPFNITGITKPNSLVAVSGESEDFIIKASADGTFNQDVSLVNGINQIVLSSYTPQGEHLSKNLTVVYSSDFNKSTVTQN